MIAQRRALLFYTLWLLIVFVSAHDAMLLVQNRYIMKAEQNIGKWSIDLNGGDPLMLAKWLGTVVDATVLLILYGVAAPSPGQLASFLPPSKPRYRVPVVV